MRILSTISRIISTFLKPHLQPESMILFNRNASRCKTANGHKKTQSATCTQKVQVQWLQVKQDSQA